MEKQHAVNTRQSDSFTLQGLVPHVQCRWCRVETRKAELLAAPHCPVLELVAPVPGLIHRPHCDGPGEGLQLQNREERGLRGGRSVMVEVWKDLQDNSLHMNDTLTANRHDLPVDTSV